jgi:hypothetical protein
MTLAPAKANELPRQAITTSSVLAHHDLRWQRRGHILLALRVIHQLVPHCIEYGEGGRERQAE